MSCCVIALALAMQIITAWRRFKSWCGIAPRAAPVGDRGLGTIVAITLDRLRRPAVKFAVLTAIAIEGAWLGGWVYDHRIHVGNEMSAVVFATTGYVRDGCDGVLATR